MSHRRSQWFGLALLCTILLALIASSISSPGVGAASGGKVLILKSTLWNPTNLSTNPEVQAAVGLGKTVEVADDTQWGNKTAAQFATYDAIILGDPKCPEGDAHSILGAAEANTAVWGPKIKGNVVIVATDPTYHALKSILGAQMLITDSIKFATGLAGSTGAYISLSCYYSFANIDTPVPVLDAFSVGGFKVVGQSTDTATLVPPVPAAFSDLTDALLSNWHSSVHESFTANPSTFKVLANATGRAETSKEVGPNRQPVARNGIPGPASRPYILYREGQFALTVTKAGPGSGTVTSVPSGVNCGPTCVGFYNSGTSVTLTAAPAIGSYLVGWSGSGCSGTGTCTVTMDTAKSVTATFGRLIGITVAKNGNGSGTVTSNPPGINCGKTCSSQYPEETLVTLTAVADPGSTFTGWSGSGCSGTGQCKITAVGAKLVTATFQLPVSEVPEADTMLLMVGGLGGLATWLGWQRRRIMRQK